MSLLRGVFVPVLTPFDEKRSPDTVRLERHCRWLVDQGVGLVPFGTTSEANSLDSGERKALLEHLVEAGLDAGRMMPGTGCCSLPETVALTRHAVGLGCAGVLVLPPFYYKRVSDEGLYRHFAAVIEGVGDARLRLYLYHIPPIAQVGISVALIERLMRDFPETVVGLKDSSGDWENTRSVLEAVRGSEFRVFSGSEEFLLRVLRAGGAGCITATANVNPGPIRELYDGWEAQDAEQRQSAIDVVRGIFSGRFPLIPALKAALAEELGDPGWNNLRPPLVELSGEQRAELMEVLRQAGFALAA